MKNKFLKQLLKDLIKYNVDERPTFAEIEDRL